MSTSSQGRQDKGVSVAPVPDPEWLRAKRRTIHTEAQLREFGQELEHLVDHLDTQPGFTVPAAVGWTVGGILLAGLMVLSGWGLWEMGAAMMGWLNE